MEPIFKNRNFLFWQKWLFYSSLIFAFFAIIFSFLQDSLIFILYDKMIAKSLWHSNQFPKDAEPFRSFIYGPMGATIACCYILVAFIAWYPFKEKQVWARNAIIAAFSVWVIVDSLVCIYFEVYPQVYIINAFSITIKALPIIFTWNDFKNQISTKKKL